MKPWTELFSDFFHNPSVIDLVHIYVHIYKLDIWSGLYSSWESSSWRYQAHCRDPSSDIRCLVGCSYPLGLGWCYLYLTEQKEGIQIWLWKLQRLSQLETVGEVFAKLLLNRLTAWISPSVILESQYGFKSGRGTTNMIFSVRQLQEKCIEHCMMPLISGPDFRFG